MCTVNSQLYVFQYSNVQNYLVLTEMDKKLKVTPPNAVKNNKRWNCTGICETELPSYKLNKRKRTVQTVSVITYVYDQ